MQPRYSLKKIIIAGIILIIIAILIGIFFIRRSENNNSTKTPTNLFPYGTTATGGTTATPANVGTQQGTVPTAQSPLSLAGADLLRELANYPVTNFYSSSLGANDSVEWNAKQTGIIMAAVINPNIIVETQKSKTQIPDAQELWIGNSGSTFVYRTWNAINKTIDSLVGSIPKPANLAYCTTTFGADLKQGSKNSDVAALETYLNYKLHLGLATDGSYGPKLVTAIKALQKSMDLPQTGIFDDATRGAVNNDCATVITAATTQNSTPQNLTGVGFLATDILRGAVSPDGTQIFYLVPTADGVSGVIANIDGSIARQIWSSPLTEWRPQWVNNNTIAMTTLASGQADGYLYFLNVSTGNFEKVLGPISGLTTLVSPDGTTVMISQSTGAGFTTGFYTVANGNYRSSDLVTLPEKCSWSSDTLVTCGVPQSIPSGTYPDDWYQGTVSFADNLWSINTETGTTTDILNPTQSFDMTNVTTSQDDSYVYFINKTDGTLWSYRLK